MDSVVVVLTIVVAAVGAFGTIIVSLLKNTRTQPETVIPIDDTWDRTFASLERARKKPTGPVAIDIENGGIIPLEEAEARRLAAESGMSMGLARDLIRKQSEATDDPEPDDEGLGAKDLAIGVRYVLLSMAPAFVAIAVLVVLSIFAVWLI